MKILMYRWKAYNQFDLLAELARRGHQVEEITGEMANFEDDSEFIAKMNRALDAGMYDLVITVNFFPMISDLCQERNLRYVAWCCDSPIATMYHASVFNSVNTIYMFDKMNQLEFEAMGAPVYYLPLCSAVDRVDRLLAEDARPGKYRADISFVGSMYRKNAYDEIYEHLSDYRKGYFDAALKMQMNAYGIYLLDDVLDAQTLSDISRHFVLAKTERSFSDFALTFSSTVLGFKIAQMERQSVLAALSERFNVDVYTDDDSVSFVRAKKHPTVDYWSDAPKVYHESKINLNLTLRSIRSGIPLRVWDILGAGGFCITNYQPELFLYFEADKDLVYFEDRQDLVKKVDYYLTHEQERQAIAQNGYRKVKKLHQYRNRLDAMKERIPEI